MLPKAALQRLQPTTSRHGVFEGLAGPDVEFGNAAIFPALIAPTRFHMILVIRVAHLLSFTHFRVHFRIVRFASCAHFGPNRMN